MCPFPGRCPPSGWHWPWAGAGGCGVGSETPIRARFDPLGQALDRMRGRGRAGCRLPPAVGSGLRNDAGRRRPAMGLYTRNIVRELVEGNPLTS
jgi:hypothetical protein